MNWKKEAADKLRNYTARQQALTNIAEELRRLEIRSTSIRSASADGTPVRHGRWEKVPDMGYVDCAGRQVYHLNCTVCGFYWRETGHAKYFRFCPNCGAKMDLNT